jgi:hypothetical protein
MVGTKERLFQGGRCGRNGAGPSTCGHGASGGGGGLSDSLAVAGGGDTKSTARRESRWSGGVWKKR